MRNNLALIMLALILGLLFSTNPTREDLIDWYKAGVQEAGGPVVGWLGAQVGGWLVAQNVTRTNLGFASLYRIRWPQGEETLVLGVLGQFVQLSPGRVETPATP